MAASNVFDLNSVGGGGGGLGGFGGGENLPIWLLLFLAIGGRNGGLFGGGDSNTSANLQAASDGAMQSKLDCLTQGQEMLAGRITDAAQAERFNNLTNTIQTGFNNQTTAIYGVGSQINALERTTAEGFCDLRAGQAQLGTAIAMQTNTLQTTMNGNTQAILNAINDQNITALQTANSSLQAQLNRAEILAGVQALVNPTPVVCKKLCPSTGVAS